MTKYPILSLIPLYIIASLCAACGGKKESVPTEEAAAPEQKTVRYLPLDELRGVWVDADSQSPFIWVRGDSAYFTDNTSLTVPVRLSEDSLWLGHEGYLVEERKHTRLSLQTYSGHTVELQKTEHPEDTLLFLLTPAQPVIYTEKTTRDTVTFCGQTRLHSYVTVNPTTRKVFRTTYNAEGMAVENFYYDNVIHLSVYEGKKCLFRRNFEKADFAEFVPAEFLEQAILSDIIFAPTHKSGPHFHAQVCIPDGAACYMIEITVDPQGEFSMALRDY